MEVIYGSGVVGKKVRELSARERRFKKPHFQEGSLGASADSSSVCASSETSGQNPVVGAVEGSLARRSVGNSLPPERGPLTLSGRLINRARVQ